MWMNNLLHELNVHLLYTNSEHVSIIDILQQDRLIFWETTVFTSVGISRGKVLCISSPVRVYTIYALIILKNFREVNRGYKATILLNSCHKTLAAALPSFGLGAKERTSSSSAIQVRASLSARSSTQKICTTYELHQYIRPIQSYVHWLPRHGYYSPVVSVDKCCKDIGNLTTKMSQLRIAESPFTYFKMPGELRNMIYKELVLVKACDTSSFKVIYSGLYLDLMSRFKEHQPPLLVNRQIKDTSNTSMPFIHFASMLST